MRHVGAQLKAELMDVFGQRKLLRRPLPGLAHFFVFWGFIILILTIIEAYGDLFSATFAIPLIGHARVLGFLEDLFAVGVLFALVTFTASSASPRARSAGSAEAGSTGPTPRRRGSPSASSSASSPRCCCIGAPRSIPAISRTASRGGRSRPDGRGRALGSRPAANQHLETTFLILQLVVIWGFFMFVLYSKHMHIFVSEPERAASPAGRRRSARSEPPRISTPRR